MGKRGEHKEEDYFVHESSYVDDGALVGKGTRIWHFCHVMSGARIGEDCVLGQNVNVGSTAVLGNNVRVQNNVSIYDEVVLEDDVFCGPSMVFTNVINPRSHVSRKDEYKRTLVKKGASLGANCTVVCGNTIGEYAFVGAGAVVSKDVAPYSLVVGVPARHKGWMCSCGVGLPFSSAQSTCRCAACGALYKKEGDAIIPVSYQVTGGTAGTGGTSDTAFAAPVGMAAAAAMGPRCAAEADAATESAFGCVPVPLLDLRAQYDSIRFEIDRAIRRVVESQHFILGPEVDSFESEIAAYCDCKHAIGVSSGTDALLAALMALGIGPGDEVVTPAYSFFATAGVVARLGAVPVFVDVEEDSFNLSPEKLEAVLSEKTRAVIPVHLFGRCAEMGKINDLCEARGIPVIEDACQAIGAEYNGRRAGALGTMACFSFFPSKNLGAFGDGGLVTTNDDELAETLRRIRVHGAKPKYHHEIVGGNFRLDAIQAAVLRVKLRYLDVWSEARRRNADLYDSLFADADLPAGILITPRRSAGRHVFNQYVVRTKYRDELKKRLDDRSIGSAVYYPETLHKQSCFSGLADADSSMPVSETLARTCLALPIYPELTSVQVKTVVREIVKFFR